MPVGSPQVDDGGRRVAWPECFSGPCSGLRSEPCEVATEAVRAAASLRYSERFSPAFDAGFDVVVCSNNLQVLDQMTLRSQVQPSITY